MYTGPHIIKDGLVFGYDTGYGIADNKTSTRFYPGRPTTNLQSANQTSGQIAGMSGVSLTYVGEEDGYSKYSMSGTFSGGTYPYCMYLPGVSFSGNTAYSTQVKLKTTATHKFNYFGGGINYVNQPQNSGGTNSSVLQSDGFNYIKREGFNYVSTTTQSGYIHSNPINNTTFNSSTDFVYVKHFQIEQNTQSTPWTSTTRSSTASLIDLKETTDIDVSNVSFDSTGQPDFDGSDDEINIGTGLGIQNASFSVEAVIKWDGGSTDTFFGYKGATDASQQSIHWRIYDTGLLRFDFYSNSINSGGGAIVAGEWAHLTVTYDYNNDTCICYKNGILLMQGSAGPYTGADSTSTGYVGSWGPNNQHFGGQIPIFRVYNKTLTATEIKQNFNAYKNRFDI